MSVRGELRKGCFRAADTRITHVGKVVEVWGWLRKDTPLVRVVATVSAHELR